MAWAKTCSFNRTVKEFHDEYCRQPDMTAAKQSLERYKNIIERELRAQDICKRLDYTGSSYERVKVNKSRADEDLEFDIQVTMVGGDKLQAIPVTGHPGFARLAHKNFLVVLTEALTDVKSLVRNGNQLPEETARQFYSGLQKIINGNEEMSRTIKLRRHGPAIQMDVYMDDAKRHKFYSVDLVPTFEIDEKRYVSKQLQNGDERELAWRQSFSLDEKAKLKNIDRCHGCRRQVLRVLKVIRNQSAELKPLESCHLKRALFKVVDEKPNNCDWNSCKLGARVIDVLKRIENELANDSLSHYFVPNVNEISSWKTTTIDNIRNRIHNITSSRERFTALLASIETRI